MLMCLKYTCVTCSPCVFCILQVAHNLVSASILCVVIWYNAVYSVFAITVVILWFDNYYTCWFYCLYNLSYYVIIMLTICYITLNRLCCYLLFFVLFMPQTTNLDWVQHFLFQQSVCCSVIMCVKKAIHRVTLCPWTDLFERIMHDKFKYVIVNTSKRYGLGMKIRLRNARSVVQWVLMSHSLLESIGDKTLLSLDRMIGGMLFCLVCFKWHKDRWPCDFDCSLYTENSFSDLVVAGGGAQSVSQTHLVIDIFIFSTIRMDGICSTFKELDVIFMVFLIAVHLLSIWWCYIVHIWWRERVRWLDF